MESPLWARIGKRIKKLRDDRGWSQRELGRQAEVSQTTISELEAGTRNPSIHVMMDLAEALQVDVGYLLLEEEAEEEEAEAEALRRTYLKLDRQDKDTVNELIRHLYQRAKKR